MKTSKSAAEAGKPEIFIEQERQSEQITMGGMMIWQRRKGTGRNVVTNEQQANGNQRTNAGVQQGLKGTKIELCKLKQKENEHNKKTLTFWGKKKKHKPNKITSEKQKALEYADF